MFYPLLLLFSHPPASDEPNHPIIKDFIERSSNSSDYNLDFFFWSDFDSLYRPYKNYLPADAKALNDPIYIGQVELVILANSGIFIGTIGSTFTDHISMIMPAYGSKKGEIARREQLISDQHLKLAAVAYQQDERPDGFKPPIPDSELSKELEETLFRQLPNLD